ncbi:MAG: AhpC/TSA family protein [Bacteroidales bacterium]|nr:AhpC/TSA family protein [Bacteroidales bacterium]
MKQNLVLMVIALVFFSCSGKKENISIKGSFKESHPHQVYLKKFSENGVLTIDSSEINNDGRFELGCYSAEPSFYILWVENSRGITLIAFPGDKMEVYIHSGQFDVDYSVEGSPESRRVSKLVRQQHKTLEQITELSNEFERIRNSPDFASRKQLLDSIYDDVFRKHKSFSEQFILEKPGSLANLMALDQQLGRSAPVFEMHDDFRIFELVDSSLSAAYPSLDIVKNLNKKVIYTREQLKLEPGSPCPVIALADTSGKVVSLGSLKGSYVLVNFRASWCSECNAQSGILKRISAKYNPGILQIYQVSFDRTMESWKAGIEEDSRSWINVSDLKYLGSELINTFLIKKLPYYILLDKEGKILATGHDLLQIEQQINDIL